MESLLTLEELLEATKGKLIEDKSSCKNKAIKKCFFTSVATDSRNVGQNTMFVPLVGEFQNGHKYIPQAIEKGASVILLNEKEYADNSEAYDRLCQDNPLVIFVRVLNTLTGLQNAAEGYVNKFPELIKVCVTGSSGKTTTKELLVSVLKQHFGNEYTVYTQGNFNSETGLPLSVFNIRTQHKIGIFEMGMNRVNEIEEISKVLKAEYGIITNIGTAHIGILGSRQNIATEKRKAFDYIPENGAACVPEADDFADYCTEKVRGKVIKFGKKNLSSAGITAVKDNGLYGTEFVLDGVKVNLPLGGEYNFMNALGVISLAKELGVTAEEIKKGLEGVAAISGRMEIKKVVLKNGKEVTFVQDCYNANLDSMSKAIEFCSGLKVTGKKIFVLADMKELGEKSMEAHREIGKKAAESTAAVLYFVGPEMTAAFEAAEKAEASKKCEWFRESSSEIFNEICEKLCLECKNGDVVLFKGSHSMQLEKLINLMCRKDEGGAE